MSELLRYGVHDDQVLELHEPGPTAHGDGPTGVAVLVHGGYWRARFTCDLMAPMAADLVRRGWAVANVEYRRVGAGGSWPVILDDARAGVDLAVVTASERGWSGPVVTVGHSVGGQLALLTAERGVDGVVALAPVTDLPRTRREHLGDDAVEELVAASPGQEESLLRDGSALGQLPVGVPVLVVHGDADVRVPLAHSQDYVAAARSAGDDVELRTLPGVDHLALIAADAPWWEDTVAWMSALRPRRRQHLAGQSMTRWDFKYDWAGPLGAHQIADLRALVDVSDPAVSSAVERWLKVLERVSVTHLPGEVYGLGGAKVTVEREVDGELTLALRSGGDDAFDSIGSAADALHDAVADGGGARIRWIELPYEPAFT
ncbi:alpha/beta hydrolase family protein [Ornithinimicrobium avium]|uniref:Alpha/beta hydrolase n=1 Tax=Ornithinimicrobium avium TaxID=2283195 RepID=A0A345NNH5_9MICO|nr:alpha/beta hydrolase [Ornithinimicrobium avium]AXH96583.1 alpha/beta hydrolase [Ornithinimicrobium avium]